jgi:acetyl esterase/lipase
MISEEAAQFHALLEAMSGAAAPDRPIEEARAASAQWAAATAEPEGVTYQSVDADGVAAEWVTPAGADSDRALLYLHGGGYTLGSIESQTASSSATWCGPPASGD